MLLFQAALLLCWTPGLNSKPLSSSRRESYGVNQTFNVRDRIPVHGDQRGVRYGEIDHVDGVCGNWIGGKWRMSPHVHVPFFRTCGALLHEFGTDFYAAQHRNFGSSRYSRGLEPRIDDAVVNGISDAPIRDQWNVLFKSSENEACQNGPRGLSGHNCAIASDLNLQLIFDVLSQRTRKSNWQRIVCFFTGETKKEISGNCMRIPALAWSSVNHPGITSGGKYQLIAQCNNLTTVYHLSPPFPRSLGYRRRQQFHSAKS